MVSLRSKYSRGARFFPINLVNTSFARGVAGDLGAADGRGASPGSTDGSHLPAASASAEELIAIGLEPRHAYSRRHLEPLQDLSRSRMDSPQIAFLIFPSAVPELSVDPGDRGDEAVG